GQLVRVGVGELPRRNEPDHLEQRLHAGANVAATRNPVDPKRPREMVLHRLRGIQRAERILEDHLDLRAVLEHLATPALTGDDAEDGPLTQLACVERCDLPRAVLTARMETAAGGRRGEIRRRARDSHQALDRAVQWWERAQQPDRVRMTWVGAKRRGRRLLDD